MVASHYDALGRAAVMRLFPQVTPDEHTHTNLAGAELNARQVMRGLKALKSPVLQGTLSTAGVALAGTASLSLKPLGEDDRPVVDGSKAVDETVLNPRLPSLFIVGDSTVKSGGRNGAFGWGERITPYFDTSKINVVNHAIGGRSSRTFFTEGRWDKVLAQLKAGDFVLIQFGHNDGGRIGDPAMKNRASGAGIGSETVEDIKPDGSKEMVNTFGWYMHKYVADAKLKGATVILVSPVPHKDKWESGRDFVSFAEWDAAVAKVSGAYYFDLTVLISDAYKKIGAEKVATLFADARTHTNDSGAQLNAGRVVFGLKSLKDAPFAAYFSAVAQSVSAQP
jgi:lysophospholipase L1-like esterase